MTRARNDTFTTTALVGRGLTADPRLRILTAADTWACDQATNTLVCCESDLARGDEELCIGIIAHEAAHHRITRYHLFPPRYPSKTAWGIIMNAIEDARVGNFVATVWPAIHPALRHADATYGASPTPPFGEAPLLLLFARECAREAARGWTPVGKSELPPEVFSALARTRPARQWYAQIHPPAGWDFGAGAARARSRYEELVIDDLLEPDHEPPPPAEMTARTSAHSAWLVATEMILPAALPLIEEDRRRVQELLALLKSGSFPPWLLSPAPWEPSAPFASYLEELAGTASGSAAAAETTSGGPGPSSGPATPGGVGDLPLEDAVGSVAPHVETLSADLEMLFRTSVRIPQRRRMSGLRVDMGRAARWAAEPQNVDGLFIPRAELAPSDAAVLLLVDLSGSMKGSKIDAAVRGTVLLALAIQRVGIAFAVSGFQDILIPILSFGSVLDEDALDRLVTMRLEVYGTHPTGRNRPSWNDDGPCLREAADLLLAEPARERLLIVVSDGGPCGCRSTPKDLRAAVADLTAPGIPLSLVGVGLGPGTGHVRSFYPDALAEVPLAAFADSIADLLATRLAARL